MTPLESRGWVQFSLLALFALVTTIAVLLGLYRWFHDVLFARALLLAFGLELGLLTLSRAVRWLTADDSDDFDSTSDDLWHFNLVLLPTWACVTFLIWRDGAWRTGILLAAFLGLGVTAAALLPAMFASRLWKS